MFFAINLVFVFIGLMIAPVYAADWYVRSGASGNGTSWTNAWANVTSIAWSGIQPGDTIWIAGGSYGTLVPGKSGTGDADAQRIKVKRATAASHGSDTGWNAAYDVQVVLSSINWNTLNVGSYVTIDGQVDSGIKIVHGNSDSASSVSFDRGASYVTLRYLDLQGPGDTVGFHHLGDDRSIDITAWNGSSYDPVNYLKVQYSRIHGACTQVWNMNASNGTWEYNEIYNSTDSTGVPCHPNIFVTASSSNVTFRYNKIHTYDAEGIMIINGGHGSLYVYGNLWYDGQTYARVIEVQNGTNGPMYFFNNTMVNLWATQNAANEGVWSSGSVARNNIYWNAGQGTFPSHGYDFCSGSCSGAGSISTGSNPFVNYAGKNYQIVSTVGAKYPKDKGTNLGIPYNTDLLGFTRGSDGAWDIGAYEYNSGSPPPATRTPAAPTGILVQ